MRLEHTFRLNPAHWERALLSFPKTTIFYRPGVKLLFSLFSLSLFPSCLFKEACIRYGAGPLCHQRQ